MRFQINLSDVKGSCDFLYTGQTSKARQLLQERGICTLSELAYLSDSQVERKINENFVSFVTPEDSKREIVYLIPKEIVANLQIFKISR